MTCVANEIQSPMLARALSALDSSREAYLTLEAECLVAEQLIDEFHTFFTDAFVMQGSPPAVPPYVWIRMCLGTFKDDLPAVLRWLAKKGYTRNGKEPTRIDGQCTYRLGKLQVLFTAKSCRLVETGEKHLPAQVVPTYEIQCE